MSKTTSLQNCDIFEIRTFDSVRNKCYMTDPHDNLVKVVFAEDEARDLYEDILVNCEAVSMQYIPSHIQANGIPVYKCVVLEGHYDDPWLYRDPPALPSP